MEYGILFAKQTAKKNRLLSAIIRSNFLAKGQIGESSGFAPIQGLTLVASPRLLASGNSTAWYVYQ